MIMIIGQKIVWGRWYFQGMPGIQQADMEENQWHLDGAFFFFFKQYRVGCQTNFLLFLFFIFLPFSWLSDKTGKLFHAFFLFHNMGNKMLISFLLDWQAL